jgi:hypothetical protein
MKRIIKVLVVTALMVVLMATTVSQAFAAKKDKHPSWWGGPETCDGKCGYGPGVTGHGQDDEPDGPEGWPHQ